MWTRSPGTDGFTSPPKDAAKVPPHILGWSWVDSRELPYKQAAITHNLGRHAFSVCGTLKGTKKESASLPLVGLELMTLSQEPEALTTWPPVDNLCSAHARTAPATSPAGPQWPITPVRKRKPLGQAHFYNCRLYLTQLLLILLLFNYQNNNTPLLSALL